MSPKESILKDFPIPLIHLDQKGELLDWSTIASDFLEVDLSQKRKIHEHIALSNPWETIANDILTNSFHKDELSFGEDNRKWLALNFSILHEGFLLTIDDTSKLRETETRLSEAEIVMQRIIDERDHGSKLTIQALEEREQLMNELVSTQSRTQLIIDSVSEGIYLIGSDGNTIFMNPAACEMLGYQSDEVVGKHNHEVIHHTRIDGTPYPASECPIHHTAVTGEPTHVDVEVFWKKDGSYFPVEYSCNAIKDKDQNIIGAVVNFKDITKRKEADKILRDSKDQLEALNQELELKVVGRTKKLNEEVEMRKEAESELVIAKDEAESANKAKSTFLANMSHEIRSPLNAIVGFSQILINQGQKLDLSSSFMKYLDNIRVSSQNLSEIINDVLDLSKIESGKMSLSEEDMNLKQMVQSVYHLNKGFAKDKNVVLEYDFNTSTPQFVKSDRSKLRQILMNLVSNAIKFTETGKRVQIKTGFENDQILLIVQDEGVGISKEKQKQVFDPFVQADSDTTREYGGTGLGLAITKEMITLLGGSIQLESQEGKGTTVTVFIPFKIAERIVSDKEAISLDKVNIPKGTDILVVEDNPMNQEMIKALFGEMNHEIRLAGSGEEGIKLSKDHKPDLVFMDIHMPGMDGFEAMQQIKEFDPSIPIIGLSADAFSDQQATALKSGFEAYLTKPIQTDQLVECLSQFLKIEPSDVVQKKMTKADLKKLNTILSKLSNHEIYETEKLVEVIDETNELLPNHLKEEVLNLIYAGDKVGMDEKVKQILNG